MAGQVMPPTGASGPSTDRPLWRSLWTWALGAVLSLWLVLAGLAYSTGYHEAEEIGDGLLVSAAHVLLSQPVGGDLQNGSDGRKPTAPHSLTSVLSEHAPNAYTPDFHVLVWQDDRLVWDSHGMQVRLPKTLVPGHQTLHLPVQGQAQEWRVYMAESDQGGSIRRVAVLLDLAGREALAADITEHILLPALLFLPLVAVVLAWAMRRGLLPLKRLSDKISALDVDAGHMLVPQQPYQELGVTVQAINHLVQRLQGQIERERRFAADVAHELRTPLTALVLQARRARHGAAQEQAQALQAVEQGALQAGRILSQLLDLTRAQSLSALQPAAVDLCALAHGVVAEHAALAHERGQDIALEALPSPCEVPGQFTLLELALRNLVDNALRHNPPGTYVEVRVARDPAGQMTLSVSDDGVELGAAPQLSPKTDRDAQSEPGLGIGLTLVERIALSQGAQLVRDAGVAPFGKRFALVWPASAPKSGLA